MIKAVVVRESGVAVEKVDEEFLGEGGVVVDVAFSDMNYKDGLAVTGRPGVVRNTPLIAGIDLVGTVAESDDPNWKPGDWIVINGAGQSETKHGGFTQRAHVDAGYAVKLPEGLTAERAAALGTAGYTAALSVLRVIGEGATPADGPVLVTGATGGVGSIATMLLASAGFEVAALTGRAGQFDDYLHSLGATQIVPRSEFEEKGRPLQRAVYSAVVDAVGGAVLANAIARTNPGGTVAACGLAGSAALPATVMPFILRGVTLAGIDSVWASLEDRADAWRLLAQGVDATLLDSITTTIGLDEVIGAGTDLLEGRRHGRTLVRVAD